MQLFAVMPAPQPGQSFRSSALWRLEPSGFFLARNASDGLWRVFSLIDPCAPDACLRRRLAEQRFATRSEAVRVLSGLGFG